MSSSKSDHLIDRMQLASAVLKWRNLAIVTAILLAISLIANLNFDSASFGTPHIASIRIDTPIFDSQERKEILESIAENDKIEAVILHLNTPGGTMSGSEALYHQLQEIQQKKPLVIVMEGVAASGGYLISMAGEYIIARNSTLTGSIGVLMQTAEFTELANKLGISFVNLKTGEYKGTPSPFEKLTPAARRALDTTIADSFNYFIEIIVQGRKLPEKDIRALADGRIFTGRQALAHKLIDEIGDQENALNYLEKNYQISADLKVIDYKLYRPKNIFNSSLEGWFGGHDHIKAQMAPGLKALWSQ